MNKSEHIENLAKSLVEFQSKVGKITKNGDNPFFKSKYATLDHIWNQIRETMAECNLAVSQFPSEVGLVTVLLHNSGEYIEVESKIHFGNKPQEHGSALTYARRYALSSVLGLVTEEDDDGNKASQPNKCQSREGCDSTDTRQIDISGQKFWVCPKHSPNTK